MEEIPFLKPKVVTHNLCSMYFDQVDVSRIYSNNGPLNQQFEERIRTEVFHGVGNVVTVNNATTGLILAISQLKRPGRYALMPSFTFAATSLSALWCGLEPYFIDIDPKRWCMDENQLEKVIQHLGDDVAVVIPYATFGTRLDLSCYESLLRRNIPVVVDAASSFGSTHSPLGERFNGAIVYSFHATKLFGIGEGGLVYSYQESIIQQLRQAANFGFDESRQSHLVGLNGKLPEYMAAIGLATLDVFHNKVACNQQIENWYMEALDKYNLLKSGWKLQECDETITRHFLSILCPKKYNSCKYIHQCAEVGIQLRTYFSPPCHRQELFKSYPRQRLDVTEDVSDRIMSLPIWEDLTEDKVYRIVRCLADV